MGFYTKKPVKIEARRLVGMGADQVLEVGTQLANWCGGVFHFKEDLEQGTSYLEIATLEGVMTASFGDYIIKGVQGEYYPCKPDIFDATYERAED